MLYLNSNETKFRINAHGGREETAGSLKVTLKSKRERVKGTKNRERDGIHPEGEFHASRCGQRRR